MNRIGLCVLVLLMVGKLGYGQTYLTKISGKVVDRNTGRPVEGAKLVLPALEIATLSDELGKYEIEDVPAGRYVLEVTHYEHEPKSYPDLLVVSGKQMVLNVELEYLTYNLETEGLYAIPNPKLSSMELFSHSISVEETKRVAAVFFDPARLAPTFPGVVQSDDQANHLIIRGNSPHGVLWRLEGAEIIAPNHTSNAGTATDRPTLTGGGVSMLSTQLLSNSEFSRGSFSAGYGNALSGVFDLGFRPGNKNKTEFTVQTGLLGIDLSAEGPLKKGGKASYLVNYRYSTVGLLSLLGVPLGDEDIRYQDLAFNFDLPTEKAGDFSFFGLLGNSRNEFSGQGVDSLATIDKERFDILFTGSSQIYGGNHKITLGDRMFLKSTVAWSSTNQFRDKAFILDSLATTSLSSEQDVLNYSLLSANSTLSTSTRGNGQLKAGLIFSYRDFEATSIFREPGVAEPYNFASQGRRTTWLGQAFLQWAVNLGSRLRMDAGLHTLYYRMSDSWSVEPRLAFNYFLNAKMRLKAAAGIHSQLQYPGTYLSGREEVSQGLFVDWNTYLGFSKARHYGLSYVWLPKPTFSVNLDAYFQDLYNIPVYQDTQRLYSVLNLWDGYVQDRLMNTGKGRNYGVEGSLERKLSANWYTLWSGTVFRSEYLDKDGNWAPSRYDSRYATSLTAGWERGRENKKGRLKTFGVNLRGVYRGGMRAQPIDLDASRLAKRTVFDQTNGFSEELPDYFRLDMRFILRVDKPKFTGTLGIDLQNMLNTQNVSYYYYDFLSDQQETRTQLGIIPNLSYRMEF